MLLTPAYREQLREMHTHDQFGQPWGNKGFRHMGDAIAFADGGSILDYGSGKGTLREAILAQLPDADVRNYDPGIPEDAADPSPADLVICTDVLEHIEPDHLDAVLAHIFALARQRVILSWALTKAKRVLPDGRNAHLIIEPAKWWVRRIKRHSRGWERVHRHFGRKSATLWMMRAE